MPTRTIVAGSGTSLVGGGGGLPPSSVGRGTSANVKLSSVLLSEFRWVRDVKEPSDTNPIDEAAEKLPAPTPPKTGSPLYMNDKLGLSGLSIGVVWPGVLPTFWTVTDQPSG